VSRTGRGAASISSAMAHPSPRPVRPGHVAVLRCGCSEAPALEVDVFRFKCEKLRITIRCDPAASTPIEVNGVLGWRRGHVEASSPEPRRHGMSGFEQLRPQSQLAVVPADVEERQLDEVGCRPQATGVDDRRSDQPRAFEHSEEDAAAVEGGFEQRHGLGRLARWPSGDVEEIRPQDQPAISELVDPFHELSAVDGPEQADLLALKPAPDQVGHPGTLVPTATSTLPSILKVMTMRLEAFGGWPAPVKR
jgi:hypothetical protein